MRTWIHFRETQVGTRSTSSSVVRNTNNINTNKLNNTNNHKCVYIYIHICYIHMYI